MCSPSPPPAPDYAAAARTQGGANLQSTIANSVLNRPNESNPFGSRTWTQTGDYTIPEAEGNAAVTIPTFRTDTTLTPQGQQLQDSSTNIALNLAGAGEKALGGVNSAVGTPLDLSSLPQGQDAVTDAMYRRQTRLLDPQYDQLQDKANTDLINRGFSAGDAASTKVMDNIARQRDAAYGDARDRAITTGSQVSNAERQQAINEILLKRQQPLAELASLRTGAAPQMPNFQAYSNGANSAPAPAFNAAVQQGKAAQDQYGADVASSNNTMSGLASLGGAAMLATSMF